MAFQRSFNNISALRQESLFTNRLRGDVGSGAVFPAVRKDRIDFYHKGGKLFSYDAKSGFTTHQKYASVIIPMGKNPKTSYVNDGKWRAIESFEEGYDRIKENCSLYSGDEAAGISRLYEKFSCARSPRPPRVVVLDIEIALERDRAKDDPEPTVARRASTDRIDLLLYDTESGLLRFFEAKHFSNGVIRAIDGRKPAIVEQMDRYRKRLNLPNAREEILAAYKVHIEVINNLFSPQPSLSPTKSLNLDPEPRLLIFGFDKSQRDGKATHEIKRLEEEFKLSVYPIGDVAKAKADTIFVGGTNRW